MRVFECSRLCGEKTGNKLAIKPFSPCFYGKRKKKNQPSQTYLLRLASESMPAQRNRAGMLFFIDKDKFLIARNHFER